MCHTKAVQNKISLSDADGKLPAITPANTLKNLYFDEHIHTFPNSHLV